MHVALLLEADPPGGDPRTDVAAVVARLELVHAEVERRGTPIAVSISGPALSAVRHQAGTLVEELAGRVEWVRTVWDAPDLTTLPHRVIEAAVRHETAVWESAGLEPGTLSIAGPWEPRLVATLASLGERVILMEGARLRPERGGVLRHLDSTIAAIGVFGVPDTFSPDRSDSLEVWRVADPSRLDTVVDRLLAAATTALTTPADHTAAHAVTGSADVRPSEVREVPESTVLRNKVLRLSTRMPERAPTDALEHLLEGANQEGLSADATGPLRRRLHESLIRARRLVDDRKRRGDEWGRVRRIDWDADGRTEVQIETAGISLVIDPDHGTTIPVLDDKVRTWAAGFLTGEPPGTLFRLVDGDGRPVPVEARLDQVEEEREHVQVVFSGVAGRSGTVRCRLRVSDRSLRLRYEADGLPAGRLGPRLDLALGRSRARADGAEWIPVTDTTSLTGHRFRLDGPRAQVLAGSMIPTECTLRAHDDGVIAWLHWSTTGAGIYESTIDLAPPESTNASAS